MWLTVFVHQQINIIIIIINNTITLTATKQPAKTKNQNFIEHLTASKLASSIHVAVMTIIAPIHLSYMHIAHIYIWFFSSFLQLFLLPLMKFHFILFRPLSYTIFFTLAHNICNNQGESEERQKDTINM